jgi:hypothetical protein
MLTIERSDDTAFNIQPGCDSSIAELDVDVLSHIGGGEGIVIPI